METKAMKIVVIEDDIEDCNKIIECSKRRKDIEIVAITDSDVNGLKIIKEKHPEGIILDLELNNSSSGNTDSFGFMSKLKKLNLNYEPIVIVTTHINSKRTYDILHRDGVELILYKGQPNFSYENVLNNLTKYYVGENELHYVLHGNSCKVKAKDCNICGVFDKMGLIGIGHIKDSVLFMDKVLRQMQGDSD